MSRITAAIQHSSSPNFTSTGRHKSLTTFSLPHASKKSRKPRTRGLPPAGWLAKKCQSFFFHELHIHRTSQKPLRNLHYTQARKTARTRGLPPASCWLTNVSKVPSYNPRQDTAVIRRFLLAQLCATNGAKARKLRNTTIVEDSTPNHVT